MLPEANVESVCRYGLFFAIAMILHCIAMYWMFWIEYLYTTNSASEI